MTEGSSSILNSVNHFWIPCDAKAKLTHVLALLEMNLVQKKVLLFTNTIESGVKLMLFLEKFTINAAFLNPDSSHATRMRTITEFNAGSFDYLIVSHDDEANTQDLEAAGQNASGRFNTQWKNMSNDRSGVVISTELKNVYTVIHFEMSRTAAGYIHRIGCTGQESNRGASVSLVSPDEMEAFKQVKITLDVFRSKEEEFIVPFPSLTTNAVESLKYKAKFMEKTLTRAAVCHEMLMQLTEESIASEDMLEEDIYNLYL